MRPEPQAMRTRKLSEVTESARLPSLHKRALYGICAVLWLSGAYWLYVFYFAGGIAELGSSSPVPALLPELHGAAAMAFLLAFGALLPQHVPSGWRQKRQRPTGLLLVLVCAILVLTGWGLYYFSEEALRAATRLIHSILGILLPLAMGAHVWRVRRRSRLDAIGTRVDDSSYPAASSAGR
jgi:hypothetical protein